jgi:hypothetical protein
MTESDWATSTDPAPMLAFLRYRGASDRKLRLFAVTCCRLLWDRLTEDGLGHGCPRSVVTTRWR